MTIVEIIPHLYTGGGEKFVVDFSNELVRLGHSCTIVTLYGPTKEELFRSKISSDVRQISLQKTKGIDLRCMLSLVKYIYQNKPEVVHVHLNAITYIVLSAIFCKSSKFVATIHSEAKREAGSWLNRIIRKFLFNLHLVTPVTISQESELSFEKFYSLEPKLIYNGSSRYIKKNPNKWQFLRKDVDLLFFHAGRIQSVKNQIMLVRAFNYVIKNGAKIRLVLAGRVMDPDIYSEIKKYESDNIVYLGEIGDIRDVMHISDGFCLSSNIEGMPITIIEAFSVGCIPICTPVGGCVNMITPYENGYLSRDVSEEAYVEAIQAFISTSSEERAIMKQNAMREFNEKYSIETTVKSYLKVFQNEA